MKRKRVAVLEIKSYRDLKVWQLGMDLVVDCYRLTKEFPSSELYGLAQQLRRAAVSIPSNIAEGSGRLHLGDYVHHLSIANGSLMEFETQLMIAQRLSFIGAEQLECALDRSSELGRMLAGLMQKLHTKR